MCGVTREISGDGNVTRCILDLSSEYVCIQHRRNLTSPTQDPSGFRFMQHLSVCPEYDMAADAEGYLRRVVDFFTTIYVPLLGRAGHHIIYHHDARATDMYGGGFGGAIEGLDEDWSPHTWGEEDIGAGESWTDITGSSDMYGFDLITAISQSAINRQLHWAWELARGARGNDGSGLLYKWSHEGRFQGTFQPITIRLLSHEAAIIWVRLDEGLLQALGGHLPVAG